MCLQSTFSVVHSVGLFFERILPIFVHFFQMFILNMFILKMFLHNFESDRKQNQIRPKYDPNTTQKQPRNGVGTKRSITKRPMLQNAQLHNAQCNKRPMHQNAQCNKTPNYKTPNVTKRPMQQNAQCNKTPNYKTPNVTKCPMQCNWAFCPITKRPMLQKVHILCEKIFFFQEDLQLFCLSSSESVFCMESTFDLNLYFQENAWRRYSVFLSLKKIQNDLHYLHLNLFFLILNSKEIS